MLHGEFSDHHYKPLPYGVEIKSIDGSYVGLFATKNIPGGSYLGVSHMLMYDHQTKILGSTVMRSVIGGCVNHSDTPNCAALILPNNEIKEFGVASHMWTIVPIEKGTELTIFYTDGYEDIIDNYGYPENLAR